MMAGVAELSGRGLMAVIAGKQRSYLGICLASPVAWILYFRSAFSDVCDCNETAGAYFCKKRSEIKKFARVHKKIREYIREIKRKKY